MVFSCSSFEFGRKSTKTVIIKNSKIKGDVYSMSAQLLFLIGGTSYVKLFSKHAAIKSPLNKYNPITRHKMPSKPMLKHMDMKNHTRISGDLTRVDSCGQIRHAL